MKLKKKLLTNRAAALARGERVVVLHPTKGFRSRSISRVAFGMAPNAPMHPRRIKFNLIKLADGTFLRHDIPKNKYAGRRRP